MSWMKRAPGGTGAGAGPQPYAAPQPQVSAQPFTNQQNMYPTYPGGTTNIPPQDHQPPPYWQGPPGGPPAPQQFNQQYAQVYQEDYPPNANQLYQQPPYNHNYTNQPGYSNPQQGYQQNYYQNQPPQQNYPQNPANNDGWEDNWDWGWEESAKQAQKAQNVAQQPPQQDQVSNNANNANVIDESFASSNTWNWAMDDKKGNKEPVDLPHKQEINEQHTLPPTPVENNTTPEPNIPHSVNNTAPVTTEEVRTLSDREVVKERMPNLALGKRFHLENLTPQWSTESQMSQESSDGPQTHSESTYRSENQSRNSNSPGPNTDNSNFNYSHSGLDEGYTQNSEWSRQSDEPTLADSTHAGSRSDSHNELSYSMQDLNLANHENPSSENSVQVNQIVEPRNSYVNAAGALPQPANFPPPAFGMHSPAPSMSMAPAPPSAPSTRPPSADSPAALTPPSAPHPGPPPPPAASLPPPPATTASLPPPNFPPPSNSQNPFKHAGPFAHKPKASSSAPGQPLPAQAPLSTPAAVGKAYQQSRMPVGFEANLETTPDNSERPDHPQPAAYRPAPAPQHVPDNMEVAPRNDRNEYLQTAHLSSGDYGENTDFTRGAPPPGPRRMGVGRQEPEYGRSPNASGDEPPPGLARMVPGRHTEADDYRDRLIDGGARPFRRGDGQRTPDDYAPRRPLGLDRMVPGEPSDADYAQYPGAAERRVVTGLEREAPPPPADERERDVDGSDYTERAPRPPDAPDDRRREAAMEGENLQDLSAVSSAELAYSRDSTLDAAAERRDSASPERRAEPARRSSDDTDRDRAFQASPRRGRRKTSRDSDRDRDRERDRDRDRDRDKDDRYSRSERKYEREDRKAPRDERHPDRERGDRRERERRNRDESPDARRKRRGTRSHKYETEDTDYYSDKERDRRRHREGSYASRPPRPHEHERRYAADRSSRARRYGTERGDGRRERGERAERGEHAERPERGYRNIDPSRKYGNRRREQEEDERRRVTFSRDAKANDNSRSEGSQYSSPSRCGSREGATDEEAPGAAAAGAAAAAAGRRERRAARHARREHEPYYDGYGAAAYGDPYVAQRAQYEYYERLRLADPAAYMQLYKRLMAAQDPRRATADLLEGYGGYEARDERGSVHSGRSSATNLKGNDTDLNTDVSLPTNLDTSTVRSDRMTPHRFSTAHVKASIASRHMVVVHPSYPVDGRPATVQLLALPPALAADVAASPGPLVKGVTHKKSVIDYCLVRVRGARREAARDAVGYGLLWELLALLLRQNGVVVGSDIAELLMKNTRDYEYKPTTNKIHNGSRRASSVSVSAEERASPAPPPPPAAALEDASSESLNSPVDERAALDKLREYLIYGNRQEALEWAMNNNLWGHALQLAAYSERRTRGAVAARFLAATPRRDPLHTLYASLAAATPPAATCVAEERWADWRPHVAIVLANSAARPDHDTRTLTMLGDSLASRGLLYSAQFCYVSGGVGFTRHPLAPLAPAPAPAATPPRLSLLLADGRATRLDQFATDRAILATEIYEYALSLNRDYVIPELQVYKFVLATRLVDAGLYERALAYVEQAARAVAAAPRDYAPALVRRLADLADRLKYHDPALHEEPAAEDGSEGSPRHQQQWLDDVKHVAHMLEAETSPPPTPQHHAEYYAPPPQYSWDQAHQYQQQQQQQQQLQQQQLQQTPPAAPYAEPEETPVDYSQYYRPPAPPAAPAEEPPGATPYAYEDWHRTEEHHAQAYAEPSYWTPGEAEGAAAGAGAGAEENPRPMITMPGATSHHYRDYDDDPPSAEQQTERDDTGPSGKEPKPKEAKGDARGGGGGGGWLGGILTKLSLRPPNQMILPDDKNPTIVWDADRKRWKNLDGDEADGDQPPPPPPKMADLAAQIQLQQNAARAGAPQAAPAPAPGAPSPSVSNIFKMQKGRHIKKSYVDVFNPSGAATRPLPPAAAVLGPAPTLSAAPAYFVPPPAPGGMYDPTADEQLRSGI